jgi:hypothetical protein
MGKIILVATDVSKNARLIPYQEFNMKEFYHNCTRYFSSLMHSQAKLIHVVLD